MGISGLLPALKSIQKTKHLSEFSGKTVAVDAYVWLHKAVYSCATELATGKPTTKYIRYAMERVRILRHHGIDPYIVFDGGPLPAKRGTEVERKLKRDESLKKGNVLAAQGRHSEAREFYLKCVDVTPQMAFQFIKALRAESVQYVVAPYEADAQLAYLERIGLVDAILTEDSDLLVFGCKHVLFKLDTVSSTVVSISRSDFSSVSSSDISLVGWSDLQFRRMAILSGCDYLPSIPGIGLKTACALMRKWKTLEQVVRVVQFEGKKSVPKGYLESFLLAEKCFLHQRVYDPLQERLVHLTDVEEGEWDEAADAYVGEDMERTIAQKIANGDADPVTRLPMNDINPAFSPLDSRVLREIPVNKGKNKAPPPKPRPQSKGGLHDFWGPNPKIPPRSPTKHKMVVGKASGKRRLADVMDHDIAVKKKKHELTQSSKFFSASAGPVAGPSRRLPDENQPPEDVGSLIAQAADDGDVMDIFEEDAAFVEQEAEYMSPGEEEEDAFDLSSPRRQADGVLSSPTQQFNDEVDPVSSPGRIRRRPTPSPPPDLEVVSPLRRGPDLRNTLDLTSDIDGFDDDVGAGEQDDSPDLDETEPGPSPSPPSAGEDPEERASRELVARSEAVAAGWRKRWSLGAGALKRRETNVTPAGKHKIAAVRSAPNSAALVRSASAGSVKQRTVTTARPVTPKLLFVNTAGPGSKMEESPNAEGGADARAQRLAQFRCPI